MRTLLCSLMLLALALDGPLAAGKAPRRPAVARPHKAPKLPRVRAPRPPRHHR